MSKRIIRIKPDEIFEKFKNSKGIALNAVLDSGKTYFGYIFDVTPHLLTLKDTRQHTHALLISTIFEVIYDHQTI